MRLLLLLVLLWPTFAEAQVNLPFTETFENMDRSYPNGWWDTGCPTGLTNPNWTLGSGDPRDANLIVNPGVSTDYAHTGTKSEKYHYAGHQQQHIDGNYRAVFGLPEWPLFTGCNNHKYFNGGRSTWYTFWELVAPGFEADEVGTKRLQFGFSSNQGYSSSYAWFYLESGGNVTFNPFVWITTNSPSVHKNTFDEEKLHIGNWNANGQWVCRELNVVFNTNGNFDGSISAYQNGVLTLDSHGWDNGGWKWGNPNNGQAFLDLYSSFTGLYVQDGMGHVYIDDFTVSSTRVGCGAVPPVDTTNPLPPTVSITGSTGASLTASWSGASDTGGSGLAGYRLDASTVNTFVSYLAGFQNLDVGNVTSKVIAGLNPSTTYYTRVRTYDGAGNTSTNSNTASGITGTVTVNPIVTSFTPDTTGFNSTATGSPAAYRLVYGDNVGSFTTTIAAILPAQFVGTHYTIVGGWNPLTQWACLYPRDSLGVENPDGYLCNQVVITSDSIAPNTPTGLQVSTLAAILLLGGFFYALIPRTSLSQPSLITRYNYAGTEVLRTVAVHPSSNNGETVYKVVPSGSSVPGEAQLGSSQVHVLGTSGTVQLNSSSQVDSTSTNPPENTVS